MKTYGTALEFAIKFNPDMQIKCAENIERSFMGTAPTIGLLRKTYNDAQVKAWIKAQVENLNDYAGTQNKMSLSQMEMLSAIISTEFYFLKASELLLFFHQFKSGKYGELYNSVDPMRVTSALQSFCVYRREMITTYERSMIKDKRAEIEEERLKTAITYEEYKRQKRKKLFLELKSKGKVKFKREKE